MAGLNGWRKHGGNSGNTLAKSLILLRRKHGGNGGNTLAKCLISLKAETETETPHKWGGFRRPLMGWKAEIA